jgi:hypothetical protein
VYHSFVANNYIGTWNYVKMKLSGDGLRLVIAMNYMNTLYYYKRNSMNDVFSISVVEGDGILGQGGVSISWDG